MIHVADLDLLGPQARLPAVAGELAVLVWAGDEVLGERRLSGYSPLHESTYRDRLADSFRERLYALRAVRAKEAPPPPPATAVTLVVCASAPTETAACLRAVGALDPAPGEIVVAPWGSSADAAARAATGAGAIVLQPRRGVAGARNAALGAARGSMLAFLTDSCRPERRYVAALCRAFAPPQVSAVSGLVAAAELAAPAQRVFDRRDVLSRSFDRRLYHRETGWPGPRSFIGAGANLAVRRAALETLGGFDETFGAGTAVGAGDDLDLLARLLDAGAVLAHEPTAVVRHVHPRSRAELLAFARAEGAALAVHRTRAAGRRGALRTLAGVQLRTVPAMLRRRELLLLAVWWRRLVGGRDALRSAAVAGAL